MWFYDKKTPTFALHNIKNSALAIVLGKENDQFNLTPETIRLNAHVSYVGFFLFGVGCLVVPLYQ